jgi:hypothetical protein
MEDFTIHEPSEAKINKIPPETRVCVQRSLGRLKKFFHHFAATKGGRRMGNANQNK